MTLFLDGTLLRHWLPDCTSCLPRDLEFFMFAVMKTFVTDISASTGRNDFIFDIWLWHGDLYRVSPFQVNCTSTFCLPCDLRIFHAFTAFSGNECWDIYKFDTNEWVEVFLVRRSVQHLVLIRFGNYPKQCGIFCISNISHFIIKIDFLLLLLSWKGRNFFGDLWTVMLLASGILLTIAKFLLFYHTLQVDDL